MVEALPYGWEAAPPARLAQRALPRRCDVGIVGRRCDRGYTGLSAELAMVHGETAGLGFAAKASGSAVETVRGPVEADHVIVATNGYTDGVDPWLRRRLVPVRSRIIATARSRTIRWRS